LVRQCHGKGIYTQTPASWARTSAHDMSRPRASTQQARMVRHCAKYRGGLHGVAPNRQRTQKLQRLAHLRLWNQVLVRPSALFIWLIIRLIQLVFSAGTVFFSHKKSANSVFQPAYNSSRTGPSSHPRSDTAINGQVMSNTILQHASNQPLAS
jgi:hypothetical protein